MCAFYVVRVGACYVLACVWDEDQRVRVHVWGVTSAGPNWQKELLGEMATVLACLDRPVRPWAVVSNSDSTFSWSLAGYFVDRQPIVIPLLDEDWLLRLIQQQFIAVFHGMEPIGCLEYLRSRLHGVVLDPLFDRLPSMGRYVQGERMSLSLLFAVVREVVAHWEALQGHLVASREGVIEGTSGSQSMEVNFMHDRMVRGRFAVCEYFLGLGEYLHYY